MLEWIKSFFGYNKKDEIINQEAEETKNEKNEKNENVAFVQENKE